MGGNGLTEDLLLPGDGGGRHTIGLHARVDASTSVSRNVTVPEGARITGPACPTLARHNIPQTADVPPADWRS